MGTNVGYAAGFPVRAVGGRLALDFINTANWRAGGVVVAERLETLEDLTVWAEALGLQEVTPPVAIETAREAREALRRLFRAEASSPAALTAVTDLRWRADDDRGALRAQPLLGLIAASAISILADPRERGRLKTCAGPDCGWLFVDETASGRRQWCSMALCGNRAKAARHYARRRSGDAGPQTPSD